MEADLEGVKFGNTPSSRIQYLFRNRLVKLCGVVAINLLTVPTTPDGLSVVAAGNCEEMLDSTKGVMVDKKERAIRHCVMAYT